MAARTRRQRRSFGGIRKLPSGRWQANYKGPDGHSYTARVTSDGRPCDSRTAGPTRPLTFDTKGDAAAWLAQRQTEIASGAWQPPAAVNAEPAVVLTLAAYADTWLAGRELEQTTRDHYAQLLADHVLPTFGAVPVEAITPSAVRAWHAAMLARTGPTARAHAYGLLRTICGTAVADELIGANPCRVRGAGSVKRAKEPQPATLAELDALTAAMPERYRLMVLLAAWCALRFGELAELRRGDVDTRAGVLRVRRGVTRTKGRRIVKGPKSDAGKRDVNIPPHLMPAVKAHLRDHVLVAGPGALLFPSATDSDRQLAPSSLYRVFYPARRAAGRPDLRFHDLRHTGLTLAAQEGATLAELMARAGHSTVSAALRYQHSAAGRDKALAERLSRRAEGTVTPIRREGAGERREEASG